MATLLLMLPTALPAPATHHFRCMTTSHVNQFNRHSFCYQALLGETSSYGCPSKGMFRTHPKPNLCIYFFSNRGTNDGSDSDDDGPQVDFSQVGTCPPLTTTDFLFTIFEFEQLSVHVAALHLDGGVKGLPVMPIEENKHLKVGHVALTNLQSRDSNSITCSLGGWCS